MVRNHPIKPPAPLDVKARVKSADTRLNMSDEQLDLGNITRQTSDLFAVFVVLLLGVIVTVDLEIDSLVLPLIIADGIGIAYFAAILFFYRKNIDNKQHFRIDRLSLIPAAQIGWLVGLPRTLVILLCFFQVFGMIGPLRRFRVLSRQYTLGLSFKIALGVMAGSFFIHSFSIAWLQINGKPHLTFEDYVSAVYYVVTTLTTVGYGDITPSTSLGRAFAMLTMILGVGVYGLVVGRLSVLIVESDQRSKGIRDRLEELSSLCRHYGVSNEIKTEATRYYHHLLSKSLNDAEQQILSALPRGLQEQIQVYMNIKPLTSISLFKGCSQQCLIAVAKSLKQVSIGPNEKVITKGDLGNEMYVLTHGVVEVHSGGHHIAFLKEGSSFGEIALVRDEERMADVSAVTYCDLFVLTREDFDLLTKRYADLKRSAYILADSRKKSG